MNDINWTTVPFDHKGRWQKKYKSIMDPMSVITFPQFVCEMVIFNRSKILKDFPKITLGKGWSQAISAQVRNTSQQSIVICNYFPHPDDESIVEVAFRNFFRSTRCMAIGGYRKIRVTKAGKLNISQAEKDCILGINSEYNRLKKQQLSIPLVQKEDIIIEDITKLDNKEVVVKSKKNNISNTSNISSLIELEKQLKELNNK